MKIIAVVIITLLLTACATTAKYEAALNTWLGHSADELVNKWGYPQGSFNAPNGNNVYVYGTSGSYTMPTQTNSTYNVVGNTVYGTSYTSGGQTLNFWCRTFFEMNESKTIVNWRWEGNNCISK